MNETLENLKARREAAINAGDLELAAELSAQIMEIEDGLEQPETESEAKPADKNGK